MRFIVGYPGHWGDQVDVVEAASQTAAVRQAEVLTLRCGNELEDLRCGDVWAEPYTEARALDLDLLSE